MNASELFQAGRLDEAIAAASAEVKAQPTDTAARYFLCELLCFAGQWERADKQLEAISRQTTQSAVQISLTRQLVRAETARQQLFDEGRVPELLVEISPVLKLCLEASIAIREQNLAEAASLLADAEQQRTRVRGTANGKPFDDFRDLDDCVAPLLEVLTSTGKYYWVPLELVETIEFRKPQRPFDLIWRSAHLVVRSGPDGEVYLPTLYAHTAIHEDDQLRLGRGTDWIGGEGEPVRGVGLRTFLVGDADRTIMQLEKVEFDEG